MKSQPSFAGVVGLLVVIAASASAQWLNYPTPGIPRLPDGKPNLSAPAPKTADGKPNLSGLWRPVTVDRSKYWENIAVDLKPGDVQPWADALYKQRSADMGKDYPFSRCLPGPRMDLPLQAKILQSAGLVLILYEHNDNNWRQIFTDGRELPKEMQPNWMGYSVGHWEGDTLVVETAGFNDTTWLDAGGHPHTEALRLTERYRRHDFGHLDLEITFDDPKAFTKPITIPAYKQLAADTELLEAVCTENEQSWKHLVGK